MDTIILENLTSELALEIIREIRSIIKDVVPEVVRSNQTTIKFHRLNLLLTMKTRTSNYEVVAYRGIMSVCYPSQATIVIYARV